jgi:hypothetical protein
MNASRLNVVAAVHSNARVALLGVALTTLSACGGDDSDRVYFTPVNYEYGLVTADLNADGRADVISAGTLYTPDRPYESGYLRTWLHSTPSTFASPVSYSAGYEPLFLATGDLNGDGRPDVVSAGFDDGAVSVYFNSATTPGTFGSPLSLTSGGASQVVIADLNADGRADIVSADFNVSMFIQSAATPGSFQTPASLSTSGANWVSVGDLNHDGAPDIVVTDAVGVRVLFHTGAASSVTYSAPASVFTQSVNFNLPAASLTAIADVDGDGFNDLVVTDPGPTGGSAPSVNVLRQDAANPGTFLTPTSYAIAQYNRAYDIHVADINGDSRPDIVIGESSVIAVLLQSAATPGTYLTASSYATPIGAYQIGLIDANGDGLIDIATTNSVGQPFSNGAYTTQPDVLLQQSTTLGTFGALQNLP